MKNSFISFRTTSDIQNRLQKIADETDITISQIVRRATMLRLAELEEEYGLSPVTIQDAAKQWLVQTKT